MKLIRMAVVFTLALGLSLGAAQAQTKKSQKGKSTTSARVVATPAPVAKSASKRFLEGSNVYGRPGLLFSNTARITAKGKFTASAHFLYLAYDGASGIDLPFGMSYGVAKNMELNANIGFHSFSADGMDGNSGLNFLFVGGKYGIPGRKGSTPDFAVGLDARLGPLSDDLGESGVDFDVYGTTTYFFPAGFLLNGEFGLLLVDGRGWDSDVVFHLSAGFGLALSPALSGIAELDVNEQADSVSSIMAGIRGGKKTQFKALLGFGISDFAPDFLLGGGVTF